MDYEVNSQEYWENRFGTDWDENLGREQTRYFAEIGTRFFPGWLIEEINDEKLTVCDLGCAKGDALPVLERILPKANLVGADYSAVAIEEARKLHSRFSFEVQDVLHMTKTYDVVFCSNVIEHFKEEQKVFEHVIAAAKKYVIIMIPFQEKELAKEHFTSFFYEDIKERVNDSRLMFYHIYDGRNDADTLYFGKQLLLVYGKERNEKVRAVAYHYFLQEEKYERILQSVKKDFEILNEKYWKKANELDTVMERLTDLSGKYQEEEKRYNAIKKNIELIKEKYWRERGKNDHVEQKIAKLWEDVNGEREAVKALRGENSKIREEKECIANELNTIKSSKTWKLIKFLQKARHPFTKYKNRK